MKKDAKRTDNPLTDRVAYKQCVSQLKAQHASNPWTQCNARFGIDKSEDCTCDKCEVAKTSLQPGMSYRQLEKKEAKQLKAGLRPEKVSQVTPAVHVKKPRQIPKVFKADATIKEWKVRTTPEPQNLMDAIARDSKAGLLEEAQHMRVAAVFKFELSPGMSYAQLKKAEDKSKK